MMKWAVSSELGQAQADSGLVSFVLGRGGEGSENLRHRLYGGKFLPLGLTGLQFV